MRTMLILVVALAAAVMLMASKCSIGDRTLPQKAPSSVEQVH